MLDPGALECWNDISRPCETISEISHRENPRTTAGCFNYLASLAVNLRSTFMWLANLLAVHTPKSVHCNYTSWLTRLLDGLDIFHPFLPSALQPIQPYRAADASQDASALGIKVPFSGPLTSPCARNSNLRVGSILFILHCRQYGSNVCISPYEAQVVSEDSKSEDFSVTTGNQ